jgi:hypothetical protein
MGFIVLYRIFITFNQHVGNILCNTINPTNVMALINVVVEPIFCFFAAKRKKSVNRGET